MVHSKCEGSGGDEDSTNTCQKDAGAIQVERPNLPPKESVLTGCLRLHVPAARYA